MKARCLVSFGSLLLLCGSAGAHDWPQLLGPERDGIYRGDRLAEDWPKSGPPVLWKKPVGAGFSGPAVAEGRLIVFHRLEDEEVIECLGTEDGQRQWEFRYPTSYRDMFNFDNGPRAVPTIAGGGVYTLGAEGRLTCVNLETGREAWHVDTRKRFGAPTGYFGMVGSPLVEGNAVMVNVGGSDGAGIVAFDRRSGDVLWKATDEEASYSSPKAATIGGQRYALFFARGGLVALDPVNGKVLFDFAWKARMKESVNAATPVVQGNRIFISASYGTGAAVLEVGDRKLGGVVWKGDDILSNHYATSVCRDGYLYGLEGRHDFAPGTSLRCIEFATGEVKWTRGGLRPANVMRAGGQLLVLAENGQLIRAAAEPGAYRETGRAQILGASVRAFPALAGGVLYARDGRQLIAVDLR